MVSGIDQRPFGFHQCHHSRRVGHHLHRPGPHGHLRKHFGGDLLSSSSRLLPSFLPSPLLFSHLLPSFLTSPLLLFTSSVLSPLLIALPFYSCVPLSVAVPCCVVLCCALLCSAVLRWGQLIAAEKAGIIKADVPVVCGPAVPRNVIEAVRTYRLHHSPGRRPYVCVYLCVCVTVLTLTSAFLLSAPPHLHYGRS